MPTILSPTIFSPTVIALPSFSLPTHAAIRRSAVVDFGNFDRGLGLGRGKVVRAEVYDDLDDLALMWTTASKPTGLRVVEGWGWG